MASINEDVRRKKIVAAWLLTGVVMIVIQIVLGGITRLTGSGLSMTEWKPIMGFIPPLNHTEWQHAFSQYQEIAQFKYINHHYTLTDFKFIFFWEWFHRVWARLLGLVFLLGFFYFLVKKYFQKDMILPLATLFILGGLQGFIGWYMVKSGVDPSSKLYYVSHVRLSIHLVSALILLCYTLWFALKLLVPDEKRVVSSSANNCLILILGIITLQLFYGAFLAGTHGAAYAPSWPKMNGYWIPPALSDNSWINNPINIQFVHRSIAYLLLILIPIVSFQLRKIAKAQDSRLLRKTSSWMLALVLSQVTLGVLTVISAVKIRLGEFGAFEYLAQTHQIVAMCLLISVFTAFYLVKRGSTVQH
ncbi:MAG: COX15/CtaA family protein [Chitinophagales bacterium]|nr:COX15/CtaA family protein [Chitinophagales bacterium]